MTSYRELYHDLVGAISKALDELEACRVISAIHTLKTALLRAEDRVLELDILPEE